MTKKLKQLAVIAAILALISPTAIFAAGMPTIPLLVYGSVTIDGQLASGGTILISGGKIASALSATINNSGKYSLAVPSENVGLTLVYKVNNNVAVSSAGITSAPTQEINLSVTIPITPTCNPSSISNGTIGAHPQCAITCNSGYNLSNGICVVISSGGGSGNSGGGGGGGEGNTSSSSSGSAPVSANTPAALTPSVPAMPTIPAPQVLGVKVSSPADIQLNQILTDSSAIYSESIDTILINAKGTRSQSSEKTTADKYLSNLTHNEKNFSSADANRLNWFITYGTVATKVLGAGERAGVLSSYKAAFGKLPKTETEWQDAVKVASGRWPSEKSATSETKAKVSFKKIYGKEANMSNQNDNAAVTIMAYGLRPSARNLASEKTAILSFKYFYKRAPSSANDWDAVRAIAYSGAKR